MKKILLYYLAITWTTLSNLKPYLQKNIQWKILYNPDVLDATGNVAFTYFPYSFKSIKLLFLKSIDQMMLGYIFAQNLTSKTARTIHQHQGHISNHSLKLFACKVLNVLITLTKYASQFCVPVKICQTEHLEHLHLYAETCERLALKLPVNTSRISKYIEKWWNHWQNILISMSLVNKIYVQLSVKFHEPWCFFFSKT